MTPEAPRLYLDHLNWSALPDELPRIYVKLLEDESVDPKQQDLMIERVRATNVEEIRSGHLPMLSRPGEMAAVLNRVATSVAAY